MVLEIAYPKKLKYLFVLILQKNKAKSENDDTIPNAV